MTDQHEDARRLGQLPGVCLHCDIANRVNALVKQGYSPSRALFDVMQAAREMAEKLALLLSAEDEKLLFEHLHSLIDQPIDHTKPIPFVSVRNTVN